MTSHGEARKLRRSHSRPGAHPSVAWRWSLESGLRSKDSRAVRRRVVGKVPSEATRWRPILPHARFYGEGVIVISSPYPTNYLSPRGNLVDGEIAYRKWFGVYFERASSHARLWAGIETVIDTTTNHEEHQIPKEHREPSEQKHTHAAHPAPPYHGDMR